MAIAERVRKILPNGGIFDMLAKDAQDVAFFGLVLEMANRASRLATGRLEIGFQHI
jgi:hypothetical protein